MRVVHEARGETLAPTGFGLPGRFSSGVRIGPPPFGLEPLLTDVRGFHPYSLLTEEAHLHRTLVPNNRLFRRLPNNDCIRTLAFERRKPSALHFSFAPNVFTKMKRLVALR